jgi:hypothetical protein
VKSLWIVSLCILSSAVTAATIMEARIYWGYNGQVYTEQWTDYSGRMGIQSQVAHGASGLDLWPTSGGYPSLDALSELTIHRTAEWQDSGKMERFSISAMAAPYGDTAYRFGVERGDGGQYWGVVFCFENTSPGVATCPLKITPEGVFVNKNIPNSGTDNWKQIK